MNRPGAPRILHVGKFYPPRVGGIESHLHALCTELRKWLALRVIVANDSRRHAENVVDGVSVTRLARLFNVSSAPVCARMAREIRDSNSDLVHIHLPNPVALVAYMMSGHTGQLVLTWHSDIVRQKFLASILRTIPHRALRRCAACIATSPNYVESSPMLTAHRDKCRVIPYGIRVERFGSHEPAAAASIRERYGPRIVLGVGRLIYYKGFEYLVRAMAHVDGNLLIVGDGPLRSRLEELARALGIHERVFFAGEIQNDAIAPYYHAADVFVLPSVARSEAFGIVQLEAMAAARPVVNTRIDSGVPFVSIDGVTGITVPPREPEALAAAITRLLDNPDLRARYGAAATRRVREEFSLETMASRTLDLYHNILPELASALPDAPSKMLAL